MENVGADQVTWVWEISTMDNLLLLILVTILHGLEFLYLLFVSERGKYLSLLDVT